MERLLDQQLLIKTQEVTVAPPHSEGFTPEHGQGRLKVEKGQTATMAQNFKTTETFVNIQGYYTF